MTRNRGKLSAFWGRLGLFPRLMLSFLAVILTAASLRSYLLLADESANARDHHRMELREAQRFLAPLLAEYTVVGDFATLQQLLDTQVRERVDIDRIRWQSRFGALEALDPNPVQLDAPAWFAPLAAVPALEEKLPVTVGGENYGTLILTVNPATSLNMVWQHLTVQLKILSLAIFVILTLTALLLRSNLKTLRQLSAASGRFKRGDHGVRVEARGAVEVRAAAHAFNDMAEEVERLLQSLAQSKRRLRAEKERALVTLSSIGDGVITTDLAGRVEYLNPVAERLTGWTTGEGQGRDLQEVFNIIHETSRQPLQNPVRRVLADGVVTDPEGQAMLLARNGGEYSIEDTAAPIRDHEGNIHGCVLIFRDVSDRRRLIQQITWQAGHDALTRLPNRALLADRLEQAIANAKRQGRLLAVGFIDLDGFKEVNDLHGHELGDRLLVEVAQRLARNVRGGDTVARLGGDEFVLLLANIADMDEMEAALNRILADIAQPYEVAGRKMQISASIGVTVYPLNDAEPESLLRHADQAMYQAKQAGRNRYHLFDESLGQHTT